MTIDRRRFLSLLAIGGAAPLGLTALAGCGSDDPRRAAPGGGGIPATDVALSAVARATPAAADLRVGSDLVAAFTGDVLARLAVRDGNLVCSPYSMVLALAMTREGAAGTTAAEMDTALGSTSAPRLDAGLNALTQTLAGRAGKRANASGTDGMIALDVACTLFGQSGVTWKQPFLDALAASYGAGVQLVDYARAPEVARARINTWTADHTADLVKELLGAGDIDGTTRLVLVNALHLKAPWHTGFVKERTADATFHRADGTSVTAAMMASDEAVDAVGRGDGWVGARLPYAGKQLAMTVLLPDAGREKDLLAHLGTGLASVLAGFTEGGAQVEMPRFTMRWGSQSVKYLLEARGMRRAFTDAADFSGMTDDAALSVADVVHQATITVDEEGTEAAAATAVVMRDSAARVAPTIVVLDRPFVYVLHDVETGTPLFVGRVSDPTA